ncbi:PaaI family thioesterase [Sneathiella chinensis]|uniref:Medium/long-chain acyl-CoA thioesterase YigI n=1 Tax=Sneathiella chinensis TaxID=349750 RepID=A0ABQ5U976_9PROT|nr:PaaI family thioesterase [Sneathiella chinensis]GLQ07735.1 thioesterase [Sneathiella chinensis]
MQRFRPQNPDFENTVRDSFSRQPFMMLVGARMERVAPGLCEIVLDHREDLTQQHGFFHGGLVSSIADSAAGYAAYSLYPEESTVLTVDLKVNFLNPAEGARLRARSEVVQAGDILYHLKADVFAEGEGQSVHCLTGYFSMMCLHGRKDTVNLGRTGEGT